MERITKQQLRDRADIVSSMLRDGLHVDIQGRNGYFGLDLYDAHGMVRTLATGTKREVKLVLDGMYEGLTIVGR